MRLELLPPSGKRGAGLGGMTVTAASVLAGTAELAALALVSLLNFAARLMRQSVKSTYLLRFFLDDGTADVWGG